MNVAWGTRAVEQGRRRPFLLVGAVLAAFCFGLGSRHALGDTPSFVSPADYAAWLWPSGRNVWQAVAVEWARQVLWGPGPAWLLGLTVVAWPAALAAPAMRGYMFGVALARAWAGWDGQGLLMAALWVAPAHLLAVAAGMHASSAAVQFGLANASRVLGRAPMWEERTFGPYMRGGLVAAALALASALVGVLGALVWRLATGTPW